MIHTRAPKLHVSLKHLFALSRWLPSTAMGLSCPSHLVQIWPVPGYSLDCALLVLIKHVNESECALLGLRGILALRAQPPIDWLH